MRVADMTNTNRWPARWAAAVIGAVALLASTSIPAQAGPTPSLCQSNESRGAVPNDFPIEACVDGSNIWLRNNLAVPITLQITGGGAPTPVQLDQSTAAIATRTHVANANVLMPNDLMRIPLGDGQGQVLLADTDAGFFYIEALTLSAFLPLGATQAAYDAFTGLITDLDNTMRGYQQCIVGKNVVQRAACSIAASASASFAVGKAVALGVAQGVAALVLNTVAWGQQVSSQIPDVNTILSGARTLSQAAVPPPAATVPPVVPPNSPPQPPTNAPPPAPIVTDAPVVLPPTPANYYEIAGTGSGSGTFTDNTNAGGPGPRIDPGATVQVTCRTQGFAVADGNTWWYLIASSPWSNQYWAPADNFYNNGQGSGTLAGTPFVDEAVPSC